MVFNDKQLSVINQINGIYIVDAGAGTGKTHSITQRYLKILETGIEPEDILLVTFTRNASIHMKEKVISKAESQKRVKIIDAPIQNFDSFCFKIVSKHGLNAPKILGIQDNLCGYKLISESIIHKRIFTKFFNQFLENNTDKYQKLLVSIPKPLETHSLIEQLLSKGIYPTKTGWFLDSETKLKGNFDSYIKRFNTLNEPGVGKKGPTQSHLRMKFNESKNYLDMPEDIYVEKQINPKIGEIVFYDDREELLEYIHHVYISYIEYMVKENSMTFSLIAMFAFLVLYEDENTRKQNSFSYIMVDEFQDTNEMQFMLLLLLLKKPNLCVVGDWKQGIYGFRNATITNIREFKSKLQIYKEQLNKEKTKIEFDLSNIITLDFDINYRSSQKILTFSEESLTTNGNKNEVIDTDEIRKDIVSLKSHFDYDNISEINFYQAIDKDTEIDYILQKVQEIVGIKKIRYFNEETKEYEERLIGFNDIAILSRTRTFGLEIQKRAFKYNIPAVYEGGIKLFEEECAIVLLAWLKFLLYKDKKDALITILEKENYSYGQIKYILDSKEYPQNIIEFRTHLLENRKIINYIIDEIFKRYNYNSAVSNAILNILDEIFHSTLMSISDLIVFIEENIEHGETYNIELNGIENAVTIQTIHGSKGLEYPIVFIVNCNLSNFPSTISDSNAITFNELVGIRTKRFFSSEHEFIFDNWKTEMVNIGLFSDMDEERRLLYVAITRAMYDIYFTAHRPSEFFHSLAGENKQFIEEAKINKLEIKNKNNIDEIKITVPIQNKSRTMSVHDFMTFQEGQIGRGKEFGTEIHKLAFRHIKNLKIVEIKLEFSQDFENIVAFINSIQKDAKFYPEIDCSLPVDGILINGIIDLVVEFEDRIEIIDWKTDLVKNNLEEYRKQLSIYAEVLKEIYPNKRVICKIFWTYMNEAEEIDAINLEKLIKNV